MSYLNFLLTIAVINGVYQTFLMLRQRDTVVNNAVIVEPVADEDTDAASTLRMRRAR